jgi:hypothetical protein
MITTTCTLTFKDGTTVAGRVAVETPFDDAHVIYSGHVHRLPRKLAKTSPAVLRVMFRNLARELGAEINITDEGKFDVEE